MTRPDLPPCPLCDAVVCSYEGTDRRRRPVVWCSEPDCRYSATMSEQHVVLARRAEVGRIVERLADRASFSVGRAISHETWHEARLLYATGEGEGAIGALQELERAVFPVPPIAAEEEVTP